MLVFDIWVDFVAEEFFVAVSVVNLAFAAVVVAATDLPLTLAAFDRAKPEASSGGGARSV